MKVSKVSPRNLFFLVSSWAFALTLALSWYVQWFIVMLVPVGAAFLLGIYDLLQSKHSIRRNFPVIGHFRYLFESIRPELQQYFVESNSSGRPFSRDLRSLVYQRAKNVTDTVPFGTEKDVYSMGYEWINHSLLAKHPAEEPPRVRVGGPDCTQPYEAAVLNVSAMSYGSLSGNAIRALNRGAKAGGFAHNTGEGGLTPHHLAEGADIIWQIGTGYFGCRDAHGNFEATLFEEKASIDAVKMIEIKLSQGAKPGHGGILPAAKLTREIAAIRGLPMGKDVISPPTHSSFGTPLEMCEFIAKLRTLAKGKPIGFKLCVGKRREFLAICKAMLETGITPDFITVDGGEGGTGAAPLEFSNVVGTPLVEGLVFVHNALNGVGLRDRIRIIASGRIVTGFDIAHKIAIGADLCNSARAMMFALGCIQAQQCNANTCPAGVATQDPDLVRGLVVGDKAVRVTNFQRNTVRAFTEILGAAGLSHPSELRPWHVLRRISPTESKHYGEMYEYLAPQALLATDLPKSYARPWRAAQASSFESAVRDA
ncbi:FMN-binding glutamate synthase family protein [Pendulispora rubella]|uniref:FMN-binding glutamate synthase family protein n=1 Tax=Pendulispora rubella TaxID=2741070 RepID=A0ABZ2KXG6_9BACT